MIDIRENELAFPALQSVFQAECSAKVSQIVGALEPKSR
jgi:hypothetical protein